MARSRLQVGKYRPVYPRIWQNADFLELTDAQKILAFYLLTGPQTNRIGYFMFSPGKASDDLGVKVSAVHRNLAVVCQAFDWQFDGRAMVFYIPSWWKFNQPDGENVLAGNMKDLAEVRRSHLLTAFCLNTAHLAESLHDAFKRLCPDPLREPSGEPPPHPSGEPSGTQYRNSNKNRNKNTRPADAGDDWRLSVSPSPKQAKPAAPDSAKGFLEWFKAQHVAHLGTPYVVKWAKEVPQITKLAQELQDTYGEQTYATLRRCATAMLTSEDDWLQDSKSRGIGLLCNQINQWLDAAQDVEEDDDVSWAARIPVDRFKNGPPPAQSYLDGTVTYPHLTPEGRWEQRQGRPEWWDERIPTTRCDFDPPVEVAHG